LKYNNRLKEQMKINVEFIVYKIQFSFTVEIVLLSKYVTKSPDVLTLFLSHS